MDQSHYEAIGRCKVLKEEIESLKKEQMQAAADVRKIISPMWGSKSFCNSDILTFDADEMHKQMQQLEKVSRQLNLKAIEFNDWADQAGEWQYSIGTVP